MTRLMNAVLCGIALAAFSCRPAPAEREKTPSISTSAEAPAVDGEPREGTGAPAKTRRPSRETAPVKEAAEPKTADVEKPVSAPEPQIIEVAIPEGTVLTLELLTALDCGVNRVGDEIQARTTSALYAKGEVVLSKGALVEGRVTEAQASGRVKGKASLAFKFDRLATRGGTVKIETSFIQKEAESGNKKDAAVIGGGAGLGALVGGIVGGKKGAAIGAAVGGASGTGVVLATKGEEIRLAAGSEVSVRLDQPITMVVR